MKVILFGATGMVGQGVLRECLLDPSVEQVLAVGRSAVGKQHDKLRELVVEDLFALPAGRLAGYDACFFCLGVSSAGMSEEAYQRVTYDLTMHAAELLASLNSEMTFIYVSGAGTDSSERGRRMWARVKGRTENALLRLPFKAYVFRPAVIRAMHGAVSRTPLYRRFYRFLGPLLFLLSAFPGFMTTTEQMGRAMLKVARQGAQKRVLESRDINAV
jgi:uncharacterized protein YbjT (DUF2867 family)